MGSKKVLITWQSSGVDCEDIYNRRLAGETWRQLADYTPVSEATLPRLIYQWAEDNGREQIPRRIKISKDVLSGCITTIDYVDKGRVWALYKARWSIKDIAIDCHCTESVVREVLNETN